MKKKKPWTLAVVIVLLLFSLTMNAQYDENRYGIQPWFGTSLMGREYSNNGNNITNHAFGNPLVGNDVTNQTFGNPIGGVDVTNQTFGAPLGSGLMVLLVTSAGYAVSKSNKRNNKNKKEIIK